jgi:universal stress protein E
MLSFTRIIVDLDAAATAHPALDRAVELARACGASLHLVDVVTVPDAARRYLPGDAEDLVIGARLSRLRRLAGSVEGIQVTVEVLSGPPAEALITAAVRGGCDLLIRSHARDLAAAPRALGSVDMQLFRHCPGTVWAVGPQVVNAPRAVLAAVHADRHRADEERLNTRILETARGMARASGGHLVVLQAWHAFAEDMLRSRYSAEDFRAYVRAAEESAREDFDQLLKRCAEFVQGAGIAFVKGLPEEVVPAYSVANGIDLVVMGTMARRGFQGWMMGNTAERLLQRLPCSIMAVKPEGFKAQGLLTGSFTVS